MLLVYRLLSQLILHLTNGENVRTFLHTQTYYALY